MKKLIFTIISLAFLSVSVQAQNIIGKWVTIDDETGDKKSVVDVYEKDGKIYGKVVKLFRKPGEDPDPVCDDCDEDDERYMKKIMGMVIMEGLSKDDDEYSGGTILKPSTGTVYRCKIWRSGTKLMVRGYVGFFYKTQTWLPYAD